MKIILKVLKLIAILIVNVLALVMLAGLLFRLLGPEPHPPEGQLIDIGGYSLHINGVGDKLDNPTVVIESGMGLPTEHYHWLSEGLCDSMRVVRYDRAGIGYSDASHTSRDPEIVAKELHKLLELAGESPPYILVGHSFGGPFIRVFTELYPDEVFALVFIDATHAERVERLDLPTSSSWTFRAMMWMTDAQAILCDLGILGIYDRLYGPILHGEGLPEEINRRLLDFSLDGKYAHGFSKEMKNYHAGLERSGRVSDFGTMPIRVFAAIQDNKERHIANGIDPDQRRATMMRMYQDFADLSTNGELFIIESNHNSIYTKKENAEIICEEIRQLANQLKL